MSEINSSFPASSSEVLLSEAATYPLTPAAMLHSSFLPDIDHAGLSRCLGVPELESPVGDQVWGKHPAR